MLQKAAVLIFLTTTMLAEPVYFGPRVPLTNTRYGAASAAPIVVANDTNVVVFWSAAHNVRLGTDVARDVLASDGDADVVWTGERFLVAANSGSTIVGRLLDANGEPLGAPFTIVQNATHPRLARDGHRIVMLYRDAGGIQSLVLSRNGVAQGTALRIADGARDYDVAANVAIVNADDGLRIVPLQGGAASRIGDAAESVSLASDGRDLLALWTRDGELYAAAIRGGAAEEPLVVDGGNVTAHSVTWDGSAYRAAYVADGEPRMIALTAGSRTAQPAPFAPMTGAAEQSLAATASTANAALIVWNENRDAHAGIRTRGGAWRERMLAANERAVAASDDGNEFVVVTQNDDGWVATVLDERGTTMLRTPRIAFEARGVAGRIVIGVKGSDVVAARIDGTPVVVRASASDPAIALDGTHALAVFETPDGRVEAALLDANAQRVDATDLLIWEDAAADPSVAFDGDRYVVVFSSRGFVKGRRVTRDGKVVDVMQTGRAGGAAPHAISLTRLGDRMGLTWLDGDAQALVLDGWDVKTTKSFATRTPSAARFVALPDRIALVHADVVDGAPYFGSSRLGVSVLGESATPALPATPHVTVTNAGGLLHVAWSSPSPMVNGHRVESRIDGGAWTEAEGWTDAGTQSATLTPARSGVYTIRVRAWSDGGTSAYSEPVEITVSGKRRAVR